MASTTRATKQVQKAFDSTLAKRVIESTKVATGTHKARIDPQAPIQGKPREIGSNAYREHVHRETVRLRKALDSVSHGKNIFAYHNIRTKQVVYSLTRYLEVRISVLVAAMLQMDAFDNPIAPKQFYIYTTPKSPQLTPVLHQENNVLRQLVYHGKKTVPAELRRDMWAPYYSVHFSDSRLGLRAYQLLREFSMQRQLSPPPEMITVTEELLDAKRPKKPSEAEAFDKLNKKRLGLTMEKRERARVLMNQKATSVADIAAVVAIQDEAIANGFLERDGRRGYLTRKARQRRRAALEEAAEQAEENEARVEAMEARLSEEKEEDIKIAPTAAPDPENPAVVKILWRDVHDAKFAQSWSDNVLHGALRLTRDAQIMPLEDYDGEVNLVNSRGEGSETSKATVNV